MKSRKHHLRLGKLAVRASATHALCHHSTASNKNDDHDGLYQFYTGCNEELSKSKDLQFLNDSGSLQKMLKTYAMSFEFHETNSLLNT